MGSCRERWRGGASSDPKELTDGQETRRGEEDWTWEKFQRKRQDLVIESGEERVAGWESVAMEVVG